MRKKLSLKKPLSLEQQAKIFSKVGYILETGEKRGKGISQKKVPLFKGKSISGSEDNREVLLK